MQQELAEVAHIEGDYAFLKTNRNASCGECSSKASCGSVEIFSPVVADPTLKIKNNTGLQVGDTVQIGLPTSKLIQGTLLVYIFPLASLFIFAAIGKLMSGEGASIVAGLGGLFVALLVVKNLLAKKPVSSQFTPQILTK